MLTNQADNRAFLHAAYDQRFLLYTASGESINLENHYLGEPVILICGGPSLRDVDFSSICESGITTMGMNNSWNVYKPDLWCSVDPASTFSNRGWADPQIMKFAPVSEMRTRLRQKRDDDFVVLSKTPGKSPNTLFFKRSVGFQPDSFLSQPTLNYGERGGRIDCTGIRGSRSVMLAAIRLLYYMGFRRVYIIGADFEMGDGDHYATGERHDQHTITGNNGTYDALNHRFGELRQHFDDAGFNVVNCTIGGKLEAFDRDTLEIVLEKEKRLSPVGHDVSGWYAKHNTQPLGELDHFLARDGKAYSKWHQKVYAAAASLVVSDKSSVLDVGCGTCFGLGVLGRSGWNGKYLGVDIDPTPIVEIPDGCEVHATDFSSSDFSPDGVFDHVMCIEVFEHIQSDPIRFIEKLHKYTGRSLILSTPDKAKNPHGLYTEHEMKDMLRNVGFDCTVLPVGCTLVYVCVKAVD